MPQDQTTITIRAAGPITVEKSPKQAQKFARVMLYLPPEVAKHIKQIALDTGLKANDVYIHALDKWLRKVGHIREAEMLEIEMKTE